MLARESNKNRDQIGNRGLRSSCDLCVRLNLGIRGCECEFRRREGGWMDIHIIGVDPRGPRNATYVSARILYDTRIAKVDSLRNSYKISANLSCAIQKLIHRAFRLSTTLPEPYFVPRIPPILQHKHDNTVARVDTCNMLIRERQSWISKGWATRVRWKWRKNFPEWPRTVIAVLPGGPLRIQ